MSINDQVEEGDDFVASEAKWEVREQHAASTRVMAAILERHKKPEWTCFPEMQTTTGGASPRLDLWCMHTWPSQRFRTVAYEVKVSRGDFMREIKNPDKRAPAEKVASECYFAVPSGLVRVDEVPEGWGLVVVGSNGSRVMKAAKQREVKDFPARFVASLARRVVSPVPWDRVALWRFAGEVVDEARLKALAAERSAAAVAQARREGRIEAQREAEASPYAKEQAEYIRVVREVTGAWDAHAFREWAKKDGARVHPRLRIALQRAVSSLEEAQRFLGGEQDDGFVSVLREGDGGLRG